MQAGRWHWHFWAVLLAWLNVFIAIAVPVTVLSILNDPKFASPPGEPPWDGTLFWVLSVLFICVALWEYHVLMRSDVRAYFYARE